MGDGKKLSSLDASFLYLETPEMPMHVGSMAIFRLPDGYKGDFFEEFKAMIASRLHVAPILKARLEKAPLDIDHPSWVEDDQFDIDRHIFRASLPAPRDRATLERIVGWMHAKLLNRARPLWEFYVFEGMKDNEIGLYSKMHHACIDGGAGAALTNMIYDVSPIPRKVDPPTAKAKVGQEPRDIAANLLDSYQQLWTQPLDVAAAKSRDPAARGVGSLEILAAWPGVIGDEGLGVRGGNEQLLVAQFQFPGLGVPEQAGAGGLMPDVLPGPQAAEALAAQRQLADELNEARVVDVRPCD